MFADQQGILRSSSVVRGLCRGFEAGVANQGDLVLSQFGVFQLRVAGNAFDDPDFDVFIQQRLFDLFRVAVDERGADSGLFLVKTGQDAGQEVLRNGGAGADVQEPRNPVLADAGRIPYSHTGGRSGWRIVAAVCRRE